MSAQLLLNSHSVLAKVIFHTKFYEKQLTQSKIKYLEERMHFESSCAIYIQPSREFQFNRNYGIFK